jgi:hypothetical protein
MTINKDGSVENKTCYLRPLCNWHNSKSLDEHPFTVPQHDILELTGYMMGELAATFCLRLSRNDPFAVLYSTNAGWAYKNLSQREDARPFLSRLQNELGEEYYLLEVCLENGKYHTPSMFFVQIDINTIRLYRGLKPNRMKTYAKCIFNEII